MIKLDRHKSITVVPDTDWIEEWQQGEWEADDASLHWLHTRPQFIKEMMIKFPPSCLVKANRPLHCPQEGTVGIVTSYNEADIEHPNGKLSVRQFPDATVRSQCLPEWLEVVGYYKNLTPERIKEILNA